MNQNGCRERMKEPPHWTFLWSLEENCSHHLVKVRPRSCSTSCRKLIISELSAYFRTTPFFYFINCRKALNRLKQSGCATPSDLRRKFNMFMERSIISDPQHCFHVQLLKPALRDTDSHVHVFLHDSRWQQTFSGSCSVFGTSSVRKANCPTGILVSFCSTKQIFQQFPLNWLKPAHSFTCQRVKNSRKIHRLLLSKATQPLCLHCVYQSLHPQFPSSKACLESGETLLYSFNDCSLKNPRKALVEHFSLFVYLTPSHVKIEQ